MSEEREEGLSALLHETRTFPPPDALVRRANAGPGIYEEAEADPLAFWAAQAERLTWATPWTDISEWNSLRQVVRRRQAQRGGQLRRPPR
jgi:acetyl-CoA synthetase